ncbi:PilN domain-containing protein [Desulfolucanica intricata]|uniref:PilN domain-containing protein n=1 Tax=Desulfolucanica intricata TaxID=1285191 RepID=UPI00083249C0|nr:PilN domain-containing protein [Desulfolucanica intricata]
MYKVNLLPSELKSDYSNWKALTLKVLIFMFILLLSGIYCGLLNEYRLLRQDAAALEKVLQDKSSELQNLEHIIKDTTENGTKLSTLDNLVKNRVAWSELLLDLELIRPVDIQFTEIKISQNNVDDTGVSDKVYSQGKETIQRQAFTVVEIMGEAGSINSVTKLYKELCNKLYFQEVRLKSVEQNKDFDYAEIKFMISVILKEKDNDL